MFPITVDVGETVYFGVTTPEVITKNALFSITIIPMSNMLNTAQVRAKQSLSEVTCNDSGTIHIPIYPAIQSTIFGVVNYSSAIEYDIMICPDQFPLDKNLSLSATVVGFFPAAVAFQSYLTALNGTLLSHNADKHYISYIRYNITNYKETGYIVLAVIGWGTFIHLIDISVFLQSVSFM